MARCCSAGITPGWTAEWSVWNIAGARDTSGRVAQSALGFPIVLAKVWGLRNDPAILSCGVMPSRHLPCVISRAQPVVPAPHRGSTSHVQYARWHRAHRQSNDGRHTSYRPVAPGEPPAGERGGLLVAHVPVWRPGQPAGVPESSAAQTGPEPKRGGTRVRRTPSWYRELHHPASETPPAVAVIPRSTSRDGPASAPNDRWLRGGQHVARLSQRSRARALAAFSRDDSSRRSRDVLFTLCGRCTRSPPPARTLQPVGVCPPVVPPPVSWFCADCRQSHAGGRRDVCRRTPRYCPTGPCPVRQ
jgi:hypothetical protein